jgi:hypothetical protein
MTSRGTLETTGGSPEERAERAYEAAWRCDKKGDDDGAIVLFRQASRLGHGGAQVMLAYMLASRGPAEQAEGLRWSYRAVRGGESTAAWNLAMEYRLRGNRRRYFHWLRVAARMGDEDARRFLRVIDAIRSRGERAPMLFLDAVDEDSVDGMLRDFLAGKVTREEVVTWAGLIARGEAALGPCQSRRVAEAIEELADGSRRLTKKRATELIFKLG